MTTPLPDIDIEQVTGCWQRVVAAGIAYADDMPTVFERFEVVYAGP